MSSSIPPTMPYAILLGTYNGARFVHEFLQSCPWPDTAELIVRDDDSEDQTYDIVQTFVAKRGINATVLKGENLGAKNNFSYLLQHTTKPYFFFADQDDIWEQGKIPIMLQTMQDLENQYGKDCPLLVYSDALLMNKNGEMFHQSFFANASLPKKWNENFRNILVMPHVLGCTMLGNYALAKLAHPIPAEAVMHDAWVLQVAATVGKVCEIEQALVRYRQHDKNVFGAYKKTYWHTIQKIIAGKKPRQETIVQSQNQAKALLRLYGQRMTPKQRELCSAWAECTERTWLQRRRCYAAHGFKKAGYKRNLALWMYG